MGIPVSVSFTPVHTGTKKDKFLVGHSPPGKPAFQLGISKKCSEVQRWAASRVHENKLGDRACTNWGCLRAKDFRYGPGRKSFYMGWAGPARGPSITSEIWFKGRRETDGTKASALHRTAQLPIGKGLKFFKWARGPRPRPYISPRPSIHIKHKGTHDFTHATASGSKE